jgi:hypothetical protein
MKHGTICTKDCLKQICTKGELCYSGSGSPLFYMCFFLSYKGDPWHLATPRLVMLCNQTKPNQPLSKHPFAHDPTICSHDICKLFTSGDIYLCGLIYSAEHVLHTDHISILFVGFLYEHSDASLPLPTPMLIAASHIIHV